MLEQAKEKILEFIASCIYRVALTDASTNSWFFAYQPEIPEELNQE
ncbi:MAG TPA: cyclic lactone autoinducer peptide [Paenibacillaceae bacterium]|mgnify:CR=1 FL=1|nr:cyclic lactone autoinducer peptide [Paenibacillaceae bacterium]